MILQAAASHLSNWRVNAMPAGTGVPHVSARLVVHVTASAWPRSSLTQWRRSSTRHRLALLHRRPSYFCSRNFRPTVRRSSSPVSRRRPASFPVPVWSHTRRRRRSAAETVVAAASLAVPCWWPRVAAAVAADLATRRRRLAAARCWRTLVARAVRGRPPTLRRSCDRGQAATGPVRHALLPRRRAPLRRAASPSTPRRGPTDALAVAPGSVTSASAIPRGGCDGATVLPSLTIGTLRPATPSASCRQLPACLASRPPTPAFVLLPGRSSSSRCTGLRRPVHQCRLNSNRSNGNRSKIYDWMTIKFASNCGCVTVDFQRSRITAIRSTSGDFST